MPAVLILGATSTIGRGIAAQFAAHGYDLILGGRDREELQTQAADLALRYGVNTVAQLLDVLNFESHETRLEPCLAAAGDALQGAILCIGYLGDQTSAQTDFRKARAILDTNFTACVSVLNIIANHFEKKGCGFICALSSVAGDRGRPSNYFYGAAKAGLAVYLQGLRNRLYRSGVRVITIKPGFVDTRMTFGRAGLFLVASPGTAARGVYKAVAGNKDVVYLPWFWRWIMLLVRMIPEGLFKRLRL